MREVCGTVSGAVLVLGLLCGYADPGDAKAKTDHYHLIQEFARRFREINGTIICRELLQGVKTKPGNDPEARTPEYYASRPCLRHCGEAAESDEMAEAGAEAEESLNSTERKLREFIRRLNPDSLTVRRGYAEPFVRAAEAGATFQFLRTGYFCKDPDSTDVLPVFNRTVSLRDSFSRQKG